MKKVTFLDSDTYFRLKKDLHTFLQFSQRLNSISKKVLVHVRFMLNFRLSGTAYFSAIIRIFFQFILAY